jgi:hypothetical protein
MLVAVGWAFKPTTIANKPGINTRYGDANSFAYQRLKSLLQKCISQYAIDLLHHLIGQHQRFDNLLIMQYIVVAECSAVAVFEPLLGWLVAADVEVPGFDGDGVEVLLVADQIRPLSSSVNSKSFLTIF